MQRLIGESSTLVETLDHVSRLAAVDRPVLVLGERGSGKELIVERLHFLSPRWEQPFHKINCAAISEQLLDSELFGHEAGAFTGATKMARGRFERADGGTLFLDELATLPLRIQEKILRLVEYGEFERLGGQQTLQVDVRIVGATNVNLKRYADEGKFRHDLLDRLAFDVVQVPPLRQRIEDLAPLVAHFGSKMSVELGYSVYHGFTAKAMQALAAYSWPGNIRELKNVVERSMCRWNNGDKAIDEVVIDIFAGALDDAMLSNAPSQLNRADKPIAGASFFDEVKALEVSMLNRALAANQYHQARTADDLGLGYHQLRALLRKYKDDLDLQRA